MPYACCLEISFFSLSVGIYLYKLHLSFGVLCSYFLVYFDIEKFPLNFHFDPLLLRGVMFNIHIFVNVLASLLLLISSFIPLRLEKILGITSVFKHLLF